MPQLYIHLSGESNNAILEKHGIVTKETREKENMLKTKECPNCQEINKHESKFCIKCRMVLTYDSYSEIRNEDIQKIKTLQTDVESLKEGINKIMRLVQFNPALAHVKPEILEAI
jgi:hypothetical protein